VRRVEVNPTMSERGSPATQFNRVPWTRRRSTCHAGWSRTRSTNPGPIRATLAVFLASFALAGSMGGESEAEFVKALLQAPQPLEGFECESRWVFGQRSPPLYVKGGWLSDENYWVERAREPFRKADQAFEIAGGKSGNLLWQAQRDSLILYDATINLVSAQAHTNWVEQFAVGDRRLIQQLVRLGLTDTDFPHATWSGLTFSTHELQATPDYPPRILFPVRGGIIQRSDRRFEITVTNADTGILYLKSVLTYDKPVGGRTYPETIEVYMNRGYLDRRLAQRSDRFSIGIERCRVISVTAITDGAPGAVAQLYDPRAIPELPQVRGFPTTVLYSNDVAYSVQRSQTNFALNRVLSAEESARVHRRDRRKPMVMTIFLASLAGTLGTLGVRTYKQKGKQQ